MNNPLISVIIPTLNNEIDLPILLTSLKKQTYPRARMELVVSDGGSKDNTLKIAKANHAKIVRNIKILAEPGIKVGMENAHGDLFMILAVDNIFEDIDAVEKIVSCFKNKDIYAAFPRHESNSQDSIFTKYINTFTDPATHFLYGYAANARTFKKLYKTIQHTPIYDVYDFSTNRTRPVLALAQGFTVRREFVNKERNEMDDISPVWELIKEKKQIAYAYSVPLYHHTIRDLGHFIRKQRWAMKNALEKKAYGLASREDALTFFQRIKMYLYPFYAISIIFPLLRSIWHIIRDKEIRWISHVYVVFLSGVAIWYEYVTITLLKINRNISRQ